MVAAAAAAAAVAGGKILKGSLWAVLDAVAGAGELVPVAGCSDTPKPLPQRHVLVVAVVVGALPAVDVAP